MREARARCGEPQIEGERKIERAAETIAVDDGYRHERQPFDRGKRFLTKPRKLLGVIRAEAPHLRHVGACSEKSRTCRTEQKDGLLRLGNRGTWQPGNP